ncbi:MAG TPA: YfhO family protein [Candidatus Udaeobacter sp.]|nr:YfhO family protein [Candidatus Udaeobacter sp.]
MKDYSSFVQDGQQYPAGAVDSSHIGPPTTILPAFGRFLVPFLTALVLLLVGVLIFHNFLLGDKVLLYKDVGADSINGSYPYFVHLSDYVRREGFPSWSFYVGMGQSLFYLTGNLIWEPVIWLPRELIAQALVFQHLLKTLVAGLLFFRFLQLRGINLCATLTGALLLSFSAYMCVGSCWMISADDVVGFTFLLFAAEAAISRSRWIYIPLAVALISLVTVFHLYLSAVLLSLYVPMRLVEMYGWKPRVLSCVSAQLAAVSFLGIGLAAIICLGSAYSILNSPRGSGTIANFTWGPPPSVFQLESPIYYVTAALRPFSTDMIGTGDEFRGWENYFEAPMTYCGLLSLLMLPQAFIGATRRQRILCGLFLTCVVVPVVFPWFRYLFWGFKGGYFRTFALFSIFGIITLSMTAFSRYMARRSFGFWTLGVSLLVLLGVLYLPIDKFQALINHELRQAAAIFLILYAALLITGQIVKRQSITGWIILLLAAIEVIHFDRITVNRPTVTKQELNERVGFNDETVDAVRDIKASDNSFFRITKTWGSGPATRRSYNDAMVFGYYGTLSYSSFNSLNYIKFLLAVDAILSTNIAVDSQWSQGLVGHPLLSTFACEKYLIAKDLVLSDVPEPFEFIRRYGSIYLFRNKLFLPFGLAFDRYIPEDIFLELPSWVKPQALLHAVVLSEQNAAHKPELSRLSLDELKQQMSETSLLDALAARRATALSIHSFKQTRIEGTARINHTGIIVFQTPFDAGWHAFSDGRPTPTLRVDAGLLGIALEEGEHTIELRYRPPLLYAGAGVTILSCSVLFLSLRRWPRIRLLD